MSDEFDAAVLIHMNTLRMQNAGFCADAHEPTSIAYMTPGLPVGPGATRCGRMCWLLMCHHPPMLEKLNARTADDDTLADHVMTGAHASPQEAIKRFKADASTRAHLSLLMHYSMVDTFMCAG